MRFSEKKEAVRTINMFNLLEDHGIIPNQNDMICCLFHDEKTPSAKVLDNVIHCHGRCDRKTRNVIDVYMQLNNLQFKEAVEEMYSRYFQAGAVEKPTYKVRAVAKPAGEKEKLDSYTEAVRKFKPYNTLISNEKAIIHKYFNSRGIPRAVEHLQKCGYGVGLDNKHTNNLMYSFDNFYFTRGMTGTFKSNSGTPNFAKFHVSKNPIWVIVEGIADALSILEMQYNEDQQAKWNVICLNSTGNTNKFIEHMEEVVQKIKNNYSFILLLDNDKAGLQAEQKLYSFFSSYGVDVAINRTLKDTEYKDFNEYWTREGARL